MALCKAFHVALLAEGVDRNSPSMGMRMALVVALLAEGVDRNVIIGPNRYEVKGSPSSRRAWIEISACTISGSRPECRPPRGGRG